MWSSWKMGTPAPWQGATVEHNFKLAKKVEEEEKEEEKVEEEKIAFKPLSKEDDPNWED